MATFALHTNTPCPGNGSVSTLTGTKHSIAVSVAGVGAIFARFQVWGREDGGEPGKVNGEVTLSGTTTVTQAVTFDGDFAAVWIALVDISAASTFSATITSLSTEFTGIGTDVPQAGVDYGPVVSVGGVAKVNVGDRYEEVSRMLRFPIGGLSASNIAASPLEDTTDTITVSLGPTSQPNAVSEYNSLKTNKLEYKFVSGETLINTSKLGSTGASFVSPYGTACRLYSGPWPQADGSTKWWTRGFLEYVIDGEGDFYAVYIRNTTNACTVIVDGKKIPGSDSSGMISNGVDSTANSIQWVKITLSGDKKRTIVIDPEAAIYSIVHSAGITVSRVQNCGKAIVFGDSFANRSKSLGETPIIHKNISTCALRLLGYDVIDTTTGSTGFIWNGGGDSQGKDSYYGYMNRIATLGPELGIITSDYSLVWLYGTGNDAGIITSSAQYKTVISKALETFPNALIVVSSVYEGFNTVASARTLNDMLYQAVKESGSRVRFVPVDSYYKWDKVGVFSGSGSVASPTYDGNADVYLSNMAQGAIDRHPNNKGCAFAAKFYSAELVRAGVPFRQYDY